MTLHDEVIAAVVRASATGFKALSNPGRAKQWYLAVNGERLYPDVILFEKGGPLRHVIEVETQDTVSYQHARAQWTSYARAPARLWLLVPAGLKDEAATIARSLELRAGIGEFWRTSDGIAFTWYTKAAA